MASPTFPFERDFAMQVTSNSSPRDLFSKREREVLRLGAEGATDGEISDRLAISVPTLRTYWLRIREKLGAVNRTHAIALAVAGPLAGETGSSLQHRLARSRSQAVAEWTWTPSNRRVCLDSTARSLFDIATDESTLPLERVLDSVWQHDRIRFERFLFQSEYLEPMTQIEFRIGASGDHYRSVRTVNLTSCRSRQDGVTILFASVASPNAYAA
jgi:DNA-binding CsgD family transcriptional regulator